MSGARVPRRSPSQGPFVPGTRLRRTYVAPEPGQPPDLGDVVRVRGRRWDVVGSHTRRAEDGTTPIRDLMLARRARLGGLGEPPIIEWATDDEVRVLGRRVLVLDENLLRSDRRDTMSDPTTNASSDLTAKLDALAVRLQEGMAALSEAVEVVQKAGAEIGQIVERLKAEGTTPEA